MDITAKAYWVPAKKVKFMDDKPAGWMIKSPETGNALSSRRYATEEEALRDAPQVLAHYNQRVRANEARQAECEQQATAPTHGYTEVDSPLYGPGRVYDDQPGATQYDDGSGRYSVQIWDNS